MTNPISTRQFTKHTQADAAPVTVAHVVDYYNRYPGEDITWYTRLVIHKPVNFLTLRIMLPNKVQLKNYRPPLEQPNFISMLENNHHHRFLLWHIDQPIPANTRYEFQTTATVLPTQQKATLTSYATVADQNGKLLAEETVTIAVWPKGKYLKYLPAIYEQDDFMGRFLMLFESFWKPIETRIDALYYYFDPQLTPSHFLPWLASWLDIEWEEHWPQEKQRQLLRWAIALHRSRGTRWGLLKYLELYTGQKAEIIEHRAKNFVLGPETRLGQTIALGHNNRPHTFTVILTLPPITANSPQQQKRLETTRRHTIETIINRQKPVHTVYTLHLNPLKPES